MIETLKKLCKPSSFHDYRKAPFPAVINGERFIVATDRHALAAVRSDDVCDDWLSEQLTQRLVAKTLTKPSLSSKAIGIQSLLDFCGSPDFTADHEECRGSGLATCSKCLGEHTRIHVCHDCDDEHECVCGECKDGKVPCECTYIAEHRVVFVDGIAVDGRLMARALAAAGANGEAMLDSLGTAVRIRGDGWTACVAMVVGAPAHAPRFEP